MISKGDASSVKNLKLSGFQKEGVKLVIRYGLHLKVLSSAKEANDKLMQLMKKCGFFLQQQQPQQKKTSKPTTLRILCLIKR